LLEKLFAEVSVLEQGLELYFFSTLEELNIDQVIFVLSKKPFELANFALREI
jgi:hypothetical protein